MTEDELRALVDDSALRRSVPAVELAEVFLERLEGARTMHAMTTITPELALGQARKVDEGRSRGERLPLDGMPIVIKDNIDVSGVPTTVGSRLFAGRTPTDDAEVTHRLREAGAVILGKANMHELAFGATSANDAFGAVVNPAAPDRRRRLHVRLRLRARAGAVASVRDEQRRGARRRATRRGSRSRERPLPCRRGRAGRDGLASSARGATGLTHAGSTRTTS